MDLWPPSADPMAQGLPISSGCAGTELFFPFRNVLPIGWMGGRYRTSKPMEAITGSHFSQSRKVPWRCGSDEQDLGNTSYHVENRAFSRSTIILKSLSYRVASSRFG